MALIYRLFSLIYSIGVYDLILIASALIVAYTCFFYYSYFTRKNPLPGPLPLPFVGNILDKGFDEFVEYAERMRQKYGDMYEIYFGPRPFIVLSKYEFMDTMFDYSLNSKYLRRIPYMEGLEELDIAGKGIALNHDVKVWKYNRHFISRAMLTPSFLKYSVKWTQNLVEDLIGFWTDSLNDDGYFETELIEWSHRFTTDSITHFTTGIRVHAMEAHYKELLASKNKLPKIVTGNDTREATKLFQSIKTLIVGIYYFIIVPPWIRNYLPFLSGITKTHLKNRDFLFNNIDELIAHRRKEIEYTPRDQPLRYDMLTSMLTANTDRDICEIKFDDKEHTEPMADEHVRAVLWETFVGGIDTTANLFAFIVYYLTQYPDVVKKLRQEVDAFFKKLDGRRLDTECLTELVYTEAVIREVFRIFTPAPYTARNSTAEDTVGGYLWPEGTQYIINILGINLNENYWDEPEKFNPDRWLNNTRSGKSMPHVVFGGGRRVCPGRKLSFVELKCMVPLVYHKLDFELVDEPKTKFILIRSFKELNVRIRPRVV